MEISFALDELEPHVAREMILGQLLTGSALRLLGPT